MLENQYLLRLFLKLFLLGACVTSALSEGADDRSAENCDEPRSAQCSCKSLLRPAALAARLPPRGFVRVVKREHDVRPSQRSLQAFEEEGAGRDGGRVAVALVQVRHQPALGPGLRVAAVVGDVLLGLHVAAECAPLGRVLS